jgi:hypothetical protein
MRYRVGTSGREQQRPVLSLDPSDLRRELCEAAVFVEGDAGNAGAGRSGFQLDGVRHDVGSCLQRREFLCVVIRGQCPDRLAIS